MALMETQREENARAFPLPSIVHLQLLTFRKATALQHCLNQLVTPLLGGALGERALPLRRPWRGAAPPMYASLFYVFSFHLQFAV